MLIMDRQNAVAPGWSHVLSTTNDVAELEAFRIRVGAPAAALQLRNRRRPHLDLKLEPRRLALASPEVRVFARTSDMIRYLRSLALVALATSLPAPSSQLLAPSS